MIYIKILFTKIQVMLGNSLICLVTLWACGRGFFDSLCLNMSWHIFPQCSIPFNLMRRYRAWPNIQLMPLAPGFWFQLSFEVLWGFWLLNACQRLDKIAFYPPFAKALEFPRKRVLSITGAFWYQTIHKVFYSLLLSKS